MGFLDQDLAVTLKQSEYKSLVKSYGKMESFIEFVKKKDYSISREDCAAILGFELNDQVKENAGTDRE